MQGPELVDSRSRFRFIESCLGLMGSLCISYAIWTPRWLDDRGLWTSENQTRLDDRWTTEDIAKALEAERVLAVVAFLMSVSSGLLCLMFALCWTSQTVRSYSNTRSLLMAGQAIDPTTLLLLTLLPTGFFFFLSWALFTHQHIGEIREDVSRLGPSYWLGVVGWASLLAVLPVVFLAEKFVVPDILPELKKAAEMWWKAPEVAHARSFSEGFHHSHHKSHPDVRRYLSVP
ncbi:uncharacterized protein LOC107670199 [Sinocyclocheilus anshuiensis]|uniref:uncharacterized protein LOC107670199 n=1 Tax=Sinocyclocheilus anshuiensis TaxID=1608454 RepID=UPI0007BA3C8A|nr:PREDICTED: uncharacterized protein LOC107670199 [Sinocyclocheilus anshuiensis]